MVQRAVISSGATKPLDTASIMKTSVFFCGENPGMTLYTPDSDQPLVVLSYWLCRYSPIGHGQALVFWHTENWNLSIDPIAGIYTDNKALARLLVETLTQYFPEFTGLHITTLPYFPAYLHQHYDEQQAYHVTCNSEHANVQLTWSGMLAQHLIVWPDFPIQPQPYDLTTVICPCAMASLRVNGERLQAMPTLSDTQGRPASSAFLAFSESWLGPK